MATVYNTILKAKEQGTQLLAVLIDPEKTTPDEIPVLIQQLHQTLVSHILVGGSSDPNKQLSAVIKRLKQHTHLPVLLFPGSHQQLSPEADALLFLSLLSGRNPEYLISQQIKAVPALLEMDLEVIPTGYVLIDGGVETSVQRVSNTLPIPQEHHQEVLHTVLAGVYLGLRLFYLEAGSGAKQAVDPKLIKAVSSKLALPLLVGGGIKSKKAIDDAFEAGADMVVIGTAFEENPSFFKSISTP